MKKLTTPKCWMVYKDGKHGCKPRKKHPTLAAAMEEASRLANLTGDKFLIVEVIGAVLDNHNGYRVAEAG